MANPGLCIVCTGENIFGGGGAIFPRTTAILAVAWPFFRNTAILAVPVSLHGLEARATSPKESTL